MYNTRCSPSCRRLRHCLEHRPDVFKSTLAKCCLSPIMSDYRISRIAAPNHFFIAKEHHIAPLALKLGYCTGHQSLSGQALGHQEVENVIQWPGRLFCRAPYTVQSQTRGLRLCNLTLIGQASGRAPKHILWLSLTHI